MTRPRRLDLDQRSTFVFEGTVQKLGEATMPTVPVTGRTIVVRVDRVVRAPAALSAYAGHDITLQLSEGEKVRRGERALFYTNGWLYGDSIAVQSLGHTALGGAEAGRFALATDPVQAKADRDLETHVAEADLVVRGRVIGVRLPASSGRVGGARPATPTHPISEHAGLWREAVIDVEEVGKGARPRKQIVVRFPSSKDVRWARVPKFHPGQEGFFLLHEEGSGEGPGTSSPAARASRKTTKRRYTALHPQDFQPLQKAREMRTLMGHMPGSPRRPDPRSQ
jgi:hypothetical protein